MRNHLVIAGLIAGLFIAAAIPAQAGGYDRSTAKAVKAALAGEHRSAEHKARDAARKPYEVLEFFGLREDMTVVEIWPGSGWYTEILAPVLKNKGQLYAAPFSPNAPYGFARRGLGAYLSMLGSAPDLYRNVTLTYLYPPYDMQPAPRGSADMVLTFRNVHNFYMKLFGGGRYSDMYYDAMFDALKPGGILGVVDHRWPDPATEDPVAANGYVSIERTVADAEAAGFKLVEQSGMLANPRDDHEHPRGVWTLPPSYAAGDEDREVYSAIGESDRFVLKFIKPADSAAGGG